MDEDLESNATNAPPAQAPRSRLLLSCGESILAVAESAYRRVEASGCAAGCLARGASRVAAPVLRPLRPRCLSALSFADRHLAAAQGAAAALFPRAERVLGGVDGFVVLVESLPARFDGAADGLEAVVACVRGGVAAAAGLVPATRARRDGKGAGNVFRDIRCDEEAGGEDVAPGAESLGVVAVAVDGNGGEDRGAGDEAKNGHGDSAAQAANREAARAEAEKQEAGCDKGKRDGDQTNFYAPGDEQCREGVKVEAVEANAPKTMEALLRTGVVKVESQQVTPPELETGEASGKDSNNNNGYLLDLFDEAWQGSSI